MTAAYEQAVQVRKGEEGGDKHVRKWSEWSNLATEKEEVQP